MFFYMIYSSTSGSHALFLYELYQTIVRLYDGNSEPPFITNHNTAPQFDCIADHRLVEPWLYDRMTNYFPYLYSYGNTGCQDFKRGIQNWNDFCLKINISIGKDWILRIGVVASYHKLDIILENEVI